MPTVRASKACAEWLSWCLSIGWRRSDLDALQSLWWKYHDEHGRLMPIAALEDAARGG